MINKTSRGTRWLLAVLVLAGCSGSAGLGLIAAAEAAAAAAVTPHATETWGGEEEYGEYLASPAELASTPVNEIVKSLRLNAQAMKLGEAVFEKNCAQCHGADLKGLAGQHTPDLTDNVWRFSGDDMDSGGRTKFPSDVEWTVRYGIRSGNPYARGVEVDMLAYDPKFRNQHDVEDFGTKAYLSEAEISDMAEYVLLLSGQPHDAAKAVRAAPLFQDNAKGNCFDCHGREGKGVATFGSTDLTRKDLYLFGSDRASIVESIVKGRVGVMPAFDGVLKPEQIKAVSVYVFRHAAR
jgi:cytochrome c oxidase cbb3-type subunit III